MKSRPTDFIRIIASVLLLLGLFVVSPESMAQAQTFPLEPADTRSPRSTLTNLLDNIIEAHNILENAAAEHQSNPGLFKTASIREQEDQAIFYLRRATGSFDFSEIPRATRRFVSVETALQIKEVLDRIPLPPLDSIPDETGVVEQDIKRWRVPSTGIDIVRIEDGPRKGEFLFDSETVTNADAMYRSVRKLPYVNRKTEGAYERFVSTPGRRLPPKWLLWVDNLPEPMHTLYYGKALWQWVALALTLIITLLIPVLVSRWLRNFDEPGHRILQVLRRMVVPGIALATVWSAELFLIWQVNFTGPMMVLILKGLLVPIVILGAYISYLLTLLVTEGIISSPRIDTASLDANMLRMIAGLLGGSLALVVLFYGASHLGFPVVPLVASLGVGGLAVALAARPTIENLIGGIILYIDRPVSVGDFCSFGDHMGTVESIGIRSIQLRARDRTIITVPNASFADMEIINWARCDMMQILNTIGVRYETTPDQMRFLLASLREMCLAHPRIDNDTVRVRFSGYGDSSQDINVRIYAITHDWNEYFAIQEDILLRIGDLVEKAGTGFAFPSRTLYMRRDDGVDTELGDAAMQKVAAWRQAGQLPFPNMTREQREKLADTLDYPPKGSPESIRPDLVHEEASESLSIDEAGDAQPGDDKQ